MEAEGQTTSSKNGPSASPNEALTGKGTSKVRTDFEGLLELAETIQRSLEEHKESYRKSVMAQQGLLLLLVLEGYAGFFIVMFGIGPRHFVPQTYFPTPPISVPLVSADVLLFLMTAFYFYSSWVRSEDLKSVSRVERRDITEVIELLREIEPVVAKEENLSVLERVQIRIRLSRFGVGSSSRGDGGTLVKVSPEDFQPREGRVDREIMKPLR